MMTVGTEGHGIHCRGVAGQRSLTRPRSGQVPEPDGAVIAGGGDERTVRDESAISPIGRGRIWPARGRGGRSRRPRGSDPTGTTCDQELPIAAECQADPAQQAAGGRRCRHSSSPVRGSQTRIPPLCAVATLMPSGWKATVPTQPEPLRKVTWGSGAAAGQSLIVPSMLPDAA